MTNHLHHANVAAALVVAAALGAVSLAACNKAAARTDAAAKPPCLGCSVDGKTTPLAADGHPDLNGYWNGAAPNPNAPARGNAGGGAGAGRVMNRYPDGSIIFDFSTEYNDGERDRTHLPGRQLPGQESAALQRGVDGKGEEDCRHPVRRHDASRSRCTTAGRAAYRAPASTGSTSCRIRRSSRFSTRRLPIPPSGRSTPTAVHTRRNSRPASGAIRSVTGTAAPWSSTSSV